MTVILFTAIDGIQYGQDPSTEGSAIPSPDIAIGRSAPPTNATTGFIQLSAMAGVPTGVPAAIVTGYVPLVIDTTDNRIYGYYSSAWHVLPNISIKINRPAQQVNSTVTLATVTVPAAADGSFDISANINVTVSTTVTMTVTCTYTDETNTSRVLTIPFLILAGTWVVSITTAQGNIAYESPVLHIRAKANTTITIATAGTVTAVTYTGEGMITQIA